MVRGLFHSLDLARCCGGSCFDSLHLGGWCFGSEFGSLGFGSWCWGQGSDKLSHFGSGCCDGYDCHHVDNFGNEL